jgi:hypothetical protein
LGHLRGLWAVLELLEGLQDELLWINPLLNGCTDVVAELLRPLLQLVAQDILVVRADHPLQHVLGRRGRLLRHVDRREGVQYTK